MAATIVPTVTALDADTYRQQIENIADFAVRIHIDIGDGQMTPQELIGPDQIWWPGGVRADIHVMYYQPLHILDTLVALGPQMIIFHAEAEGDFSQVAEYLHTHGIETGVALMPDMPVSAIEPGLQWIDHVLVFSGSIGTFGGKADLSLLDKVHQLKTLKPQLEVGWDGGINERNVRELAHAGVEVLNTGGFIQKANRPHVAYATLVSELSE